ncbi:hypothetical protein [Pseudomonas sp. NFIX28]|uniref:hypothetical protein n=1 Tax=Pseudomonas sp. NFIX28 TaxID=1566235 RepID=UPI000895CBA9|nr:hypothetical protein [Pseudomonas sp. NFIX28]SDZ63766.1 hypothetical protein SAMN03159453_05369 [Pseudomonas sp. NFIX28]
MTDARPLPPTEEERMLEHIRQHSHGEPPASLDALIMATARREAPAPRPSLWQRWFDLCRQPRWQVAFASLFGVTLLLGVLRSPEPAPSPAFAPAPAPAAKPAAPQLARRQAEYAADAEAPALKKSAPSAAALEESSGFELAATPDTAAGALSVPAPVAPMAGPPLTQDAQAFDAEPQQALKRLASSPGKERFDGKAPNPLLDDALREVLRLRQAGQGKAADQHISTLKQRFPTEDIDARLRALQQP